MRYSNFTNNLTHIGEDIMWWEVDEDSWYLFGGKDPLGLNGCKEMSLTFVDA